MASRRGPPEMSSTVRSFAFRVTRIRNSSQGTTTEGLPINAAAEQRTPILAHVWPAPDKGFERLPDGTEGFREVEGGTPDDLQISDTSETGRPDAIEYDGGVFEVYEISPWTGGRMGKRTWRSFKAVRVQRP